MLFRSYVFSVCIDQLGNKWVGTGYGVSKYDGNNWYDFTTSNGLINNFVRHIFKDLQNDIWFCTNGGVSKYDGQNWNKIDLRYVNLKNKSINETDSTFSVNTVMDGAVDSLGNVWLATLGGVFKYDGNVWEKFVEYDGLVNNCVHSVAIDQFDNKYFGTVYSGVSKYNDNTWETIDYNNGLLSNAVEAIAIDHNNNIYFADFLNVSILSWGSIGFNEIKKKQITVYPDPAKDYLYIDIFEPSDIKIGRASCRERV